MKLDINSIEIFEVLKNQSKLVKRIQMDVVLNKEYQIFLKTGEIFVNPDDDADEYWEPDDWKGRQRISCSLELYPGEREWKIKGEEEKRICLRYRESYDDGTPSTLAIEVFHSDDLIESIIENLRGNIQPEFITLSISGFQNLGEDGDYGRKFFSELSQRNIHWDNTNENFIDVESLVIRYFK